MKKTMLSIVMMLYCVWGYAQELPEIIPSSPEATQFKRYGDYPVNLSTGVPNIEIPLYTIETGSFTLPIKLQYHASGIKVNQDATWVGLGWSLSSGAQITLDVRDQADEFNTSIDSFPDENYILNNIDDLNFYETEKDFYANNSWVKDVYNVSIPTVNGKFYKKSEGEYIVYPPNAFKVSEGNLQEPYTFIITDQIGNIYKFNKKTNNNSKEITYPTEQYNERHYTSAWYVEEIETPKKDKISFVYQDDGFVNSFSRFHTFTHTKTTNPIFQLCGDQQVNESMSYNLNGTSLSTTNVKKIKEIYFNKGRVRFELERDRNDIASTNPIEPSRLRYIKIDALENGNYKTIKDYALQHSYFTTKSYSSESANSNSNLNRLKLDGISDLLGAKETIFTYDTTKELPPKDSYSQDFWGYSNGALNQNLIPKHIIRYNNGITTSDIEVGLANRNVQPNYMKSGMLTSIKYLTKGTTKFIYEGNTYIGECKTQITIGEGSLAGAGNPSILPKELSPWLDTGLYTCDSPNPSRCAQTSSYNLNVTVQDIHTLKYSFWSDDGSLAGNILDQQEDKYGYARLRLFSLIDGSLVFDSGKWNEWNSTKEFSVDFDNLALGSYRLTLEVYGYNRSVQYFKFSRLDEYGCNKFGPGLRIAKIENYDSDNSLVLTKSYNYNSPNTNLSSAVFIGDPADKATFRSKNFTSYKAICCSSSSSTNANACDFKETVTYTVNSYNSNGSESNSLVYKNVLEKQEGTNDSNGFTRYEFTTSPDYRENNSLIKVLTGWLRGNLLKKESFIVNNNDTLKVFKEENMYVNDERKKALVTGFKLFEHKKYEEGSLGNNSLTPTLDGVLEPVFYKYNIDWHYKNKTTETNYYYDSSNVLKDSLVTTTNYFYDNPSHLQQTRTEITNSKEEVLKTETKYAHDVNDQRLINEHRIAEPLEVKSYKESALLSWQKTVYDSLHNPSNLYLPSKVQTALGSQSLEDRVVYHAYDDKGNPTEVSKADGTHIVYIWGYNQTQPIAKIENASLSDIPDTYITPIKNASNADDDRTIDGRDTNGAVNNYVGNEGQLRFYLNKLHQLTALKDSQITFYTYDPLVGVTSITDPRGETMYYEYDEFNRLEFVKDSNGNLLKEHKYNYKN